MLVRDHMAQKVVVTKPERSVAEARTLLKRHRIRQLPVMRKERLIGIVTDRDLRSARQAVRTVGEVMTAKPFVISPDASVDEAARLLRTYKIGALPVVEGNALRGILTATDVLDAFVDLSGVAEPTYRIVLAAKGVPQPESRIRRVVEHCRGELKWLHRDERKRPPKFHLRLRARRLDDVVTELEATGFEVAAVVAPSRKG